MKEGSAHRSGLSLLIFFLVAVYTGPVAAQDGVTPGRWDAEEPGYVLVSTNLDSFLVVLNEDPENIHFAEKELLLELPPGEYALRITGPNARDVAPRTEVVPRDTVHYNIHFPERAPHEYAEESTYPVLRYGWNLAILTDQESEVYIEGAHAGRGAVSVWREPGTYEVTTVHPQAGSTTRRVVVSGRWPPRMVVERMYNRPSRTVTRALSPIPGAAQLYKGHYVKAGLFMGGIVVAVATTKLRHDAFVDAKQSYELSRSNYYAVTGERSALELGDRMEARYAEARHAMRVRNALFGITAVAYAFTVIEAWRAPASGFRQSQLPAYWVSPSVSDAGASIHLSIRF